MLVLRCPQDPDAFPLSGGGKPAGKCSRIVSRLEVGPRGAARRPDRPRRRRRAPSSTRDRLTRSAGEPLHECVPRIESPFLAHRTRSAVGESSRMAAASPQRGALAAVSVANVARGARCPGPGPVFEWLWYDATSGPRPGLFSAQRRLCRHANTGPRGGGLFARPVPGSLPAGAAPCGSRRRSGRGSPQPAGWRQAARGPGSRSGAWSRRGWRAFPGSLG